MSRTNRNWSDSFTYAGLCILTLGVAYFIRVIISMAIRCAFENEKAENKFDEKIPPEQTGKILSRKEAQRLRKNEVLKVTVKDGLWTCPSCSDVNRELQDACWKCGQEVDKITG